jgi:hypothetical protein
MVAKGTDGMRVAITALALSSALAIVSPASAQEITYAYTKFDAEKNCKHTPGTEVEDYGAWRCPGYGGLIVLLTAGDQRMQVSFGTSARKAADEVAAGETFAGFNSVYEGTIEWRIEKLPNGKTRPFATILRWNTRTEADAERNDGKSTGRTLVVTRLNPGGVCHVGYVDGRDPKANELARDLADKHARKFDCEKDDPHALSGAAPYNSEKKSERK